MANGRIFINYRKGDAGERAAETLSELLGRDRVFTDLDIVGGADWRGAIASNLARASAVMVLIGPRWLSAQDLHGRRRLDLEDDWVRHEIEVALRTGKRVCPVLVDGAEPPDRAALPAPIARLADRQAIRVPPGALLADYIPQIRACTGEMLAITPCILLTSGSPRRKALLHQIGWEEGRDYLTRPTAVEPPSYASQGSLGVADARELVTKIACDKIAEAVKWRALHDINRLPCEVILVGADTVVLCEGRLLDRPLLIEATQATPHQKRVARERAREMLRRERNKAIHVVSGIAAALGSRPTEAKTVSVVTRACLKDFTDKDIDRYIETCDPIDMAGAFGIQGRGITLFESIEGSYTNVVGLPLREFIGLLRSAPFGGLFALPAFSSSIPRQGGTASPKHDLSVICVGDINYDFVYDGVEAGGLSNIAPPGLKLGGEIFRGVGGTAVQFAKGAVGQGSPENRPFQRCAVVGAVGSDPVGEAARAELEKMGITPLLTPVPINKTSVAIIVRDRTSRDTSITLTDSRQGLPQLAVEQATETTRKSDVFYCSGYCLIDPNRQDGALELMRMADEAGRLVVLDVVSGMDRKLPYQELRSLLADPSGGSRVDVLVSELPEMCGWLGLPYDSADPAASWRARWREALEGIGDLSPVVVLRAADYSEEAIRTPKGVVTPVALDYGSLRDPREKLGYGDRRTASLVHKFVAPRVALASASPQRLALLRQVMAEEKIEVVPSCCPEEKRPGETPHQRVHRLSAEKARSVFEAGEYGENIELIIGADTEIVCGDENGWSLVPHPEAGAEAEVCLRRISGGEHLAVTGLTVIGALPGDQRARVVTEVVETTVRVADLSPEEISEYAATGEPAHRAGGYAIQGLGGLFVEAIEGSYSNVVGLPLEKLTDVLAREFRYPIWEMDKVSAWRLPEPIKGKVL